ncbi:MAG: M23 family metallopeptidase [Candidatus Peribacteria bacterium]|jgi:hypothetical protein|nr:M23 family metallopeptidase [Candidatus Peribacteria bacterium]
MKNLLKKGWRTFGVLAVVMVCVFSSCVQDEVEEALTPQEESTASSEQPTLRAGSLDYGYHIVGTLPFSGEATHGRPGVTYYKFFVANPQSGTTGVDIIFTAPDGANYTHSMAVLSNGNWSKEMTLSQHGRYTFTYTVYRNNTCSSYTPDPNYVDNTNVQANISSNTDNSWIKAYWVFGVDGSSYSSNSGYKNGNHIKWLDGNADGTGFGGYGWNEGTHINSTTTGNKEKYALDYNIYPYGWTSGTNSLASLDNGSILRSPLDGIVTEKENNASATYGKYVVIRQYLGAKEFRAYMGHLQDIYVQVGDHVIGGTTNIGTLGMTGATGYHLHLNIWDRTGGLKNSVKHELSATN